MALILNLIARCPVPGYACTKAHQMHPFALTFQPPEWGAKYFCIHYLLPGVVGTLTYHVHSTSALVLNSFWKSLLVRIVEMVWHRP